ncbi:hypothetical protein LguiA_025966 [Lonicera macranthoides]
MSVIHLELNVLRKNYGNNPIVVIPRISAFESQSCPRGLHCKDEVDVASTSLLITLVRVFSQIEDAEDILWVVKAITARLIDCKVDQEQSCDCEATTSDHVQIFNIELKAKLKLHCMPEQEHFKTSHGYFIHPQGSKELVGSLETEWKTTNQYLLKEHAWLQCTRRCMFALVPQLNNLLMKVTSRLSNSKSVQLGRVRLPGGNSSKRDYCYALERSQDSTLRVKQLVNAVSEKVIRAAWNGMTSWRQFVQERLLLWVRPQPAWNGMTSWRQFVQERLLLWVRPQPGVVQNQPWFIRPSSGELVELHLATEEKRYQVLRFKRMEMSASESGESALSDLIKLNTSGGLSKHRYAFLESLSPSAAEGQVLSLTPSTSSGSSVAGFEFSFLPVWAPSNVTYALVDIKCKLNFRLMLKSEFAVVTFSESSGN